LTLTAVLSPSEAQSSAEVSIQSPASSVVLEIRPDDPLVRKHPAGELVQTTPEVVNFAVERTAEVQPTVLRPHELNHDQELPFVHDLVTPPFRHKKTPPTTMAIGAPKPIEVSSDPIGALFDSPPTKLPENAAPVYPPEAQRTGRQGRVVLAVTVNASGIVDRVRVYQTSGHSDLDRVAIEAVENWRFRPATLRDTRVLAEVLVPIKFAIR
jgi:TonB family protein